MPGWFRDQIEMFQFLIGRLKTPGRCLATSTARRFQFLIGRLKTLLRLMVDWFFEGSFNSS